MKLRSKNCTDVD